MNKERYFIAFAPSPKSSIWQVGSGWLAFNAATSSTPEKTYTLGLPPEIHQQTVLPARKTGFNAILVAPFSLRVGISEENLCENIATFSQSITAFTTCLMKVKSNGNKIGIEPLTMDKNIRDLANLSVRQFNHFRETQPEMSINPKLRDMLSERQLENFIKWGHPYYFEDYKFQIPLTGAVPAKMVELLEQNLQKLFTKHLSQGLKVDSVTLFKQENMNRPAQMIRRFPLMKDNVFISEEKMMTM